MKAIISMFLAVLMAPLALAQGLPAGQPVLPTDAEAEALVWGSQAERARKEIVGVTGQPFNHAVRLHIPEKPKNPYDVEIVVLTSSGVKTGDVMLASFYARRIEPEDRKLAGRFVFESKAAPITRSAMQDIDGDLREWRQFQVPFVSKAKYPVGEGRVSFKLGTDKQIIEIGGISVVNYGNAVTLEQIQTAVVEGTVNMPQDSAAKAPLVAKAPTTSPAPKAPADGVLINSNFAAAAQPVVSRAGKPNPKVSGVLPEGWHDDSAWADVEAQTRLMEDEGEKYLRVEVKRCTSGRLQLTFPQLPQPEGPTNYRLTVRLRSHTREPIGFHLRQQAAPYKSYWQSTRPYPTAWETYVYNFKLDATDAPFGLWMMLDGEARVDITSLKLEHITEESRAAAIRRQYPDGGPANLFRNTRFPLGLQQGWLLGSDTGEGEEARITVDEKVLGPTGAPALRMEAASKALIFMEPFRPVYPLELHRLSIAVRGSGNWTLKLSPGGDWINTKNIISQPFELKEGETWRRVGLDFTPDLATRFYVSRIEGQGVLWLDAPMTGPASKAGEGFVAPNVSEVALALPANNARTAVAGVQFSDVPAEVLYAVSGNTTGAQLKARVVNIYGQLQELKSIPLGAGDSQRGALRFDLFPERPLGSFRVETWVEREGKRISPYNEIVVHRLREPRYWGRDAPQSPFGVHLANTERQLTMAKAVGLNWVRLHDAGLENIGWFFLEPKPGDWKFRDEEILRLRKHNFKVLGQLGTAPTWASHYTDSGLTRVGYYDKFFMPKDLAAWENYVRTVTTRYKGVIDTYGVWNEPWAPRFFAKSYKPGGGGQREQYLHSDNPQRDYVALQKIAHRAAKAVAPNVRIIGLNSRPNNRGDDRIGGTEWTRGVMESGGLEVSDILDYHHYSNELAGWPGDNLEQGRNVALSPITAKYGEIPKPVWMTEGKGTYGMTGSGFLNHTSPEPSAENPMVRANLQARYLLRMLSLGNEKLFLYSMHAFKGFAENPTVWSALVMQDGSLHPDGAAVSALAWLLEDTQYRKMTLPSTGVNAFLFEGKGRAVAALLRQPGAEVYVVPHPAGATVTDLFGNPVAPGTLLDDNVVYVSTTGNLATLEKMLNR